MLRFWTVQAHHHSWKRIKEEHDPHSVECDAAEFDSVQCNWVSLCWVSFCWVSCCYMLLCWAWLCWMSFCWPISAGCHSAGFILKSVLLLPLRFFWTLSFRWVSFCCLSLLYANLLSVDPKGVVLMSGIKEWHSDQCHSDNCGYDEWHFSKCQCHSTESLSAWRGSAEYHFAECHSAV